jgi:hypothetical protein
VTSGGGAKVLQIAGAGVTLCMVDSALALPEGAALQRRMLYRPPHANDASWDALIVDDDSTAYLLQMTVSDEHAVKRHGLEAGKKLLSTHGFGGLVQLVFLVPPVVFQRFRLPQKILNADGKASETADQWLQDLWHVATVDSAAYWPPTH